MLVWKMVTFVDLLLSTVSSFVPESPRWLLVHNKQDKAMSIIQNIAKGNGKPLSKNIVAHSQVNLRKLLDQFVKNEIRG